MNTPLHSSAKESRDRSHLGTIGDRGRALLDTRSRGGGTAGCRPAPVREAGPGRRPSECGRDPGKRSAAGIDVGLALVLDVVHGSHPRAGVPDVRESSGAAPIQELTVWPRVAISKRYKGSLKIPTRRHAVSTDTWVHPVARRPRSGKRETPSLTVYRCRVGSPVWGMHGRVLRQDH